MKTICIVLLCLIAFMLFLSFWGFYSAIRPIRITSSVTPANFGIKYENVSFHTKDNVLISAWFIPNKNPKAKTIILLHGYPADKGDILPSRLFLHSSYNLLFFDFRHMGKSEGYYSTIGKKEVLDLQAALQYLHERGINEVGIWGLSLGGAVALMGSVNVKEVKALVIESSFARLDWMTTEYYQTPILKYPLAWLTKLWAWIFFQYDISEETPANAAQNLTIPVLIIYSKNDMVITERHGKLLQESLKNNRRAQFIIVDKHAHGQSIKNYQTIIKQFFDKNLH